LWTTRNLGKRGIVFVFLLIIKAKLARRYIYGSGKIYLGYKEIPTNKKK